MLIILLNIIEKSEYINTLHRILLLRKREIFIYIFTTVVARKELNYIIFVSL